MKATKPPGHIKGLGIDLVSTTDKIIRCVFASHIGFSMGKRAVEIKQDRSNIQQVSTSSEMRARVPRQAHS
jgi:hypothetical protein